MQFFERSIQMDLKALYYTFSAMWTRLLELRGPSANLPDFTRETLSCVHACILIVRNINHERDRLTLISAIMLL